MVDADGPAKKNFPNAMGDYQLHTETWDERPVWRRYDPTIQPINEQEHFIYRFTGDKINQMDNRSWVVSNIYTYTRFG